MQGVEEAQRLDNDDSPNGIMSLVRSAMGMNCSGLMVPSPGISRRASASKPATEPSAMVMTGW